MALLHTPPFESFPCPSFKSKGVDGKDYTLESFSSFEVITFMFICNHCPYVQAVEDRVFKIKDSFDKNKVEFIAVCSNDANYDPDDSFENVQGKWEQKGKKFPYLYDEDQSLAKAMNAICTPDFFVFDKKRNLFYRGRLDDSWKDPSKVTREELKEAVQNCLKGDPPSKTQHPSMGCSIKWK